MKSFLQHPSLACLVSSIALGASTTAIANSDRAFMPMGAANAVDVIDPNRLEVISTATDTINTRGFAPMLYGQQLILVSLTPHGPNTERPHTGGVTEDEHAAHHGNGGTASREATNTGLLYVADTTTSRLIRTRVMHGPGHHALITQDGQQ